jgi:hypothetical protein
LFPSLAGALQVAFTSPVVVVKARVGANPVPGTSSNRYDFVLSETAPVDPAAVITLRVNSVVAPFDKPVIIFVVIFPATVTVVPDLISVI